MLILGDFLWGFFSKKRRARISLIDKIIVLPAAIYIFVVDIFLFMNVDAVVINRQMFISPIFIYLGFVYLFEGIYHYYFPGIVTGSLAIRLVICVVKSVAFGLVLPKVTTAVKKAI